MVSGDSALRELRAAAAERDSALLVMLIPNEENVDNPSKRYKAAIQLLQELGITYFDTLHALDASDYAADADFHWNNAGHQKIGALMSACLESFFASGNFAECAHVETP